MNTSTSAALLSTGASLLSAGASLVSAGASLQHVACQRLRTLRKAEKHNDDRNLTAFKTMGWKGSEKPEKAFYRAGFEVAVIKLSASVKKIDTNIGRVSGGGSVLGRGSSTDSVSGVRITFRSSGKKYS